MRREAVCGGAVCACSFTRAARREAACRGASTGRPARRAGCPAVLGIEAPPSNSLRALQALRSNNDGESVHEARCARGPQPLRSSATLRRAATHHLPRRGSVRGDRAGTRHLCPRSMWAGVILEPLSSAWIHYCHFLPPVWTSGPHSPRSRHIILSDHDSSRQRGPGGGDVGSGEKRSGRVGARSAHPRLTRRRCLSAAPEGRGASSTARPGREHRSGVGPQADRSRRPCTQTPAVARRAPQMPLMPHIPRRPITLQANSTPATHPADPIRQEKLSWTATTSS
jgi:hypothetical protein